MMDPIAAFESTLDRMEPLGIAVANQAHLLDIDPSLRAAVRGQVRLAFGEREFTLREAVAKGLAAIGSWDSLGGWPVRDTVVFGTCVLIYVALTSRPESGFEYGRTPEGEVWFKSR